MGEGVDSDALQGHLSDGPGPPVDNEESLTGSPGTEAGHTAALQARVEKVSPELEGGGQDLEAAVAGVHHVHLLPHLADGAGLDKPEISHSSGPETGHGRVALLDLDTERTLLDGAVEDVDLQPVRSSADGCELYAVGPVLVVRHGAGDLLSPL